MMGGVSGVAPPAPSPFQPHWDMYPKTYIAHKTSFPLFDNLDGDLNKDVWKNVAWSEYFDDIRGKEDVPSNHDRPNNHNHQQGTRFKALYDSTHLYIGAILESNFETKATFTQRNSPIFQKDSDFEVFIDPIGSNHNYKELEVNAINTIWNLMLDKPYDDGGQEYSGRIAKQGEQNYYEVYEQKTATKVLRGILNDDKGGSGATWSIEIAISYKDIMSHIRNNNDNNAQLKQQQQQHQLPSTSPSPSMWRINFSRVEKEGTINWTWCPQIIWNPRQQKYCGQVAMHLPDVWGYILFAPPPSPTTTTDNVVTIPPPLRDPTFPARLTAMNIYYAQKVFLEEHNYYAASVKQLSNLNLVDDRIVSPFDIHITTTRGDANASSYLVTIKGGNLGNGSYVTVTNDRYLLIHNNDDHYDDATIDTVATEKK